MQHTPYRAGIGLGLGLLLLVQPLTADDGKAPASSFKLTLASTLKMDVKGKKQTIVADTDLRYTWRRKGKEKTLRFDLAAVKASADRRVIMDTSMSRAGVVNNGADGKQEIKFADAPEQLKKTLRDSFGAAVCKVEVDDNGKLLKRTDVAGPGARVLVEQGMIANALLFHPPFLKKRDEWKADAEVSMGNGGFARGKLTCSKEKASRGRQVVRVSGTLGNEGYKIPDQPVKVIEARYDVSGEQTYDPALREWVAGKLTLKISFKMAEADSGKVFGTAGGTMVATFERLAGAKK